MRVAFGDSGVGGVKPPFAASAPPAAVSASATTAAATSLRRTDRHSMDVPDETRVELPGGVGFRYEVYLNGVRQEEGRDFRREGGELVFPQRLAREGRLGFWRWLSLFLGVAGTYRQN